MEEFKWFWRFYKFPRHSLTGFGDIELNVNNADEEDRQRTIID